MYNWSFCLLFTFYASYLFIFGLLSENYFCSAAAIIKKNTTKFGSMGDFSKKLDAKIALLTPSLEELAATLKRSLQENFANVNVTIVDCPDLSQSPYGLKAKGICGSPRIVDVGGPGNLFPVIKKTTYKLDEICKTAELESCLAIGPGAGPVHLLGYNAEVVHNVYVSPNNRSQYGSYLIFNIQPTHDSPKPYTVRHLLNTTANEFALMSNLLLSEGRTGKVLKVEASKRTGNENFVTQMRKGLEAKYGHENSPVGLGGVFLCKNGKIKMHVMSELPREAFPSKDYIEKIWLKYYDMDSPLISTSIFLSHDPGLDLRVEHSHSYSNHGDGGHYHYDISPDDIQYEGYFTPAEFLYRIDRCYNSTLMPRPLIHSNVQNFCLFDTDNAESNLMLTLPDPIPEILAKIHYFNDSIEFIKVTLHAIPNFLANLLMKS